MELSSSADSTPSGSPDPSASPADPSASPSADIQVDLTQTMFEFASGLKDGDTALTVNGVDIPNELYLYWLAYDWYYLDSYYYQYGAAADFTNQEIVDYLLDDVQTAVTYYAVLRQLCEENGISVTSEQDADLQSQIDAYEDENGEGSFQTLLQSSGLSQDGFYYVNTNSYLFTSLADKLVGEPTDADLEQYVADNGIYAVKHILLKTTDKDVTDDADNVTMTAAEKKFDQGMDGADAGYPALATHLASVLDEGFFRQEIPLEKLIPLMIANALNDKPLPVYGKGENVRDWLYVEDHCKAIDLIIHNGRVGEVYNIGGHNEMKNIDIVKIICKELGKPESLITYVEDRKGHDMRYAIDPTKIHNELGWLPETMFKDGIKKTIQWYLDNKEWWETIISGEYQNYYEKMYAHRQEVK